jgi:uncharacterized membrane protein YtjA (UPF0391 family)
MNDWMIATLMGSLVFAMLGYTPVARGFASIAKIMFYLFAVGFCVVILRSFI